MCETGHRRDSMGKRRLFEIRGPEGASEPEAWRMKRNLKSLSVERRVKAPRQGKPSCAET